MDVDVKQGRLKPVRKNGLVNGINPYQSLSWIYTLFDIVIAYIFAFQFEDKGIKELQLIVLTVIVTCIIYSCLRATLIDPTDSVVKEEQLSKLLGKEFKTDIKSYCLVCQAHVQEKTKHCWSCNKCVSKFDHHCIWLNSCIGDQNYSYFFILVSSLVALKLFRLGQDFKLLYLQTNYEILVYICISVDPPVFLVLTYLLSMHLYFKQAPYIISRWNNISTYEYIKSKNASKDQMIKTQIIQKKQIQNESTTGYGQLLSTSKRFDLKSQLSLKTGDQKSSNPNYFSNKQEEDKKNNQQTEPQLIQIPSLFTSKPTSPGNDQDKNQYLSKLSKPKDLDDLKDKQIYKQVIVEDSEPQLNESSEDDDDNDDNDEDDHFHHEKHHHCPQNSHTSDIPYNLEQINIKVDQISQKDMVIKKEIEPVLDKESVNQDPESNQQSLHVNEPPTPSKFYAPAQELNGNQNTILQLNNQQSLSDHCTR
ncbi:unnamed protein product (macronuclear) [Paramecium tetraurelia]|uniref:Palmitoyltransferase n=1 Tax=Paramecium tetraurelia TaxID=5888 RepID=A0C6N4_PARTE|nr:uncharacterized protein GSPATT00035580001 [Paramecium tetraurelia]CAK66451.1 unnamed protein product [Paramecium tetraurelia]|eukprot:XP_001433848.1 hypothetical protein (macronuclear) [Paramecium tetraurelia strain d4-2]